MKASLFALVLALGGPLPFVEAAPGLEEDAVVVSTKAARRVSSLERQKRLVLPRPVDVAPAALPIPVLLFPAPHVDIDLISSRPPPAN